MYDLVHFLVKEIKLGINRFLINNLLNTGSEVKAAKDIYIDFKWQESLLIKKGERVVIKDKYPVSGLWRINNQRTSVLSIEFEEKSALVSKDYVKPLNLIDIIKDFNFLIN